MSVRASARVSVAFKKQLSERDPTLLHLSVSSTTSSLSNISRASSTPTLPSPLVESSPKCVESEPPTPMAPSAAAASSPSLPAPIFSSTESLPAPPEELSPPTQATSLVVVEFPVLRLVPLNEQFRATELQLHSTLKFCRVLKKGNVKEGLERFQTLAFDSKCISREHADINWSADTQRVMIKDLDSTCGTRLNGKKLPAGVAVQLVHGDIVVLGDNIPEKDDGTGRQYQDAEVSASHRCVRMEIQFVAMPRQVSLKTSLALSDGIDLSLSLILSRTRTRARIRTKMTRARRRNQGGRPQWM